MPVLPIGAVSLGWHGIAVIFTPVGGLSDVMEEGKNVLDFDFGDWNSLALQLKRLMDKGNVTKENDQVFV